MYNLIVLAARPNDWTHEQFIQWWRGEHAEVTYPLPGLECTQGFDDITTGPGATIWFDGFNDFEHCLGGSVESISTNGALGTFTHNASFYTGITEGVVNHELRSSLDQSMYGELVAPGRVFPWKP